MFRRRSRVAHALAHPSFRVHLNLRSWMKTAGPSEGKNAERHALHKTGHMRRGNNEGTHTHTHRERDRQWWAFFFCWGALSHGWVGAVGQPGGNELGRHHGSEDSRSQRGRVHMRCPEWPSNTLSCDDLVGPTLLLAFGLRPNSGRVRPDITWSNPPQVRSLPNR